MKVVKRKKWKKIAAMVALGAVAVAGTAVIIIKAKDGHSIDVDLSNLPCPDGHNVIGFGGLSLRQIVELFEEAESENIPGDITRMDQVWDEIIFAKY